MDDLFDVGVPTVAPSLQISGAGGDGYIELDLQTVGPAAPAAGKARIYTNNNGNFTVVTNSGEALSFDVTSLSSARTVTFPDSDGVLVTDDSTATLTNKTLIGGVSGNIVEATSIVGNPITGTPTEGQYLRFTSSQWQPESITASAPLTFAGGNIAATVGTGANTLAAGDDARFSTAQLVDVKKGAVGAGEFSSIVAAVASITDASAAKPYIVRVGPGMFIESAIVMKPYVYLQGYGKFPSIIRPNAPGITLFTLPTNSAIEEVTLMGLGSGIGVHVDSAMSTLVGNVIAAGFATCFLFTSATGPSDVLLHEFITSPPFGVGIHVDGRAVSTSFDMNISVSTGRVRCGASTTRGVIFEGLHALVSANSLRSVDAVNGTGVYIADGTFVELGNSKITGCDIGMDIANVGAGPTIRFRDILFIDNTTYDAIINNPGTSGIFDGIADRAKTIVDVNASVAVSYRDPINPANVLRGEFVYAPANDTILTETGSLIVETADIGVYSGGVVSVLSGLTVRVTAGSGYIIATASVDYARKITWAQTDVVLSANSITYVYVNAGGVQTSGAVANLTQNVLLARVVTTASGIEFIDSQKQSNKHTTAQYITSERATSGPVYSSGSITTIGAGNTIDVTSGHYFYLFNEFHPVGGTGISMTTYRRDGSGDWIRGTATSIGSVYDAGSTLVAIPPAMFVRHTLYVVSSEITDRYLFVYGQTLFPTENDAKLDSTQLIPNYFGEGITRIAGIIGSSGGLTDVVDLRPISGKIFAASGSIVTDHGNLAGLLDDDHLQYLPVNGTRPMESALNMNANNITNAGTVNGVTVQSHVSRHLPTGADPLPTAAPLVSLSSSTLNTEGTANSFARSDHTHEINAAAFDINAIGGTLTAAKGGTGRNTLISGRVIIGAGTNAVNVDKAAPAGAFVGTTDTQTLENKTLVAATTVLSGTGSIEFSAGGTNVTTIAAVATVPIVVTLPSSTTRLVGFNTVDTLINKTIIGGNGGNNVAANRIYNVILSAVAPTAGQVLQASNNNNAAWTTLNLSDTVGVLGVANGGTGASVLPVGRVLVGNGTGTVNTGKPAPTGDFVGTSDAQTLSGKTLISASTLFQGATVGDTLSLTPTGVCNVNFAGAGTTTIPAGVQTVVGRATTDILTNKTIESATNSVTSDRMRVNGGTVSTAASPVPAAGYHLIATSATTAAWTPASTVFEDNTFAIGDINDNTIQIRFNAAGTTGTSTTLVSGQVSDISLTLPTITDTIVGRATVDTLTNKTLTAPIISTIINGGILTLPTGPETIVGRATIDTLSNKTLADTTTAIAGANGTIDFRANGSGRTRIVAAQTGNITLALPTSNDTLVGRNTTDTLSNKTLTLGNTFVRDGNARGFNFGAIGTAGAVVTLNNAATASRTLTFPDVTDVLVARSSTDTLTNKTIIGGGSGNTVAANQIRAVAVNAVVPNAGNVLIATSPTTAQWGPINAVSPNYIFGYVFVATTSTTFINVTDSTGSGCIAYPGSAELPLTRFSIFAINSTANTNSEIRLQDTTNGNTLAIISTPNGTTSREEFSTTTFANVPVGFAALEIQIRRTAGNDPRTAGIAGWHIRTTI